MNARSTVWGITLWLGMSALAAAQVPPAPAPAETEFVKDIKQLFADLTAHQARIERAEVDEETVKLQAEILATWDRLLSSAKEPSSDQPPPDQNQSPQQNPNPVPDPQQTGQQSASKPMGDQQPNSQNSQQPGDQNGEKEPGGESDAPGQTTGQATNQPADQADAEARLREQNQLAQLRQEERERLMKEVWGKLPQRIRQKLLNASDEKYLPEYEDRIREYFRKLSEPGSRTRAE